jgi:hypothetical protein
MEDGIGRGPVGAFKKPENRLPVGRNHSVKGTDTETVARGGQEIPGRGRRGAGAPELPPASPCKDDSQGKTADDEGHAQEVGGGRVVVHGMS